MILRMIRLPLRLLVVLFAFIFGIAFLIGLGKWMKQMRGKKNGMMSKITGGGDDNDDDI